MKKNVANDLQTRREFFKKAAKGALPILAFSMLGSTILSSCGDDDDEQKPSGCGTECSGGCKLECLGSCSGSCSGSCDSGCDKYIH